MYGDEPLNNGFPFTMKRTIHLFAALIAFFAATGAIAQPIPPYEVNIIGTLQNCSPAGSMIGVTSDQNNGDDVNETFTTNETCGFSGVITVWDYQGYIAFNYPCNGQIVTYNVTYGIDFTGTTSLVINLECGTPVVDCLGELNGSALPGTPCDDNDPNTINDTWGDDCICSGQTSEGYELTVNGLFTGCDPEGSSIEVTTLVNNNPEASITLTTDPNCGFTGTFTVSALQGYVNITYPCNGQLETISVPFSINALEGNTVTVTLDCNDPVVDCLGVVNGTALPGTACDDNNPQTTQDTWNEDCVCAGIPVEPSDCNAGFWVLQGYTISTEGDPNAPDSIIMPIPNEIWVWNLSTSDTGNMTFLWTFGDGTSSTEAFPTHVYDGTGPYELCLYITDASGCTDSYCETIYVDEEGLYNGLTGEQDGGSRSVITLNVVSQQPLSVNQNEPLASLQLWPNPVRDMINLHVSGNMQGQVIMEIFDLSGKVISSSNNQVQKGSNNIQFDVRALQPGMYVLKIGNENQTSVKRFMKH